MKIDYGINANCSEATMYIKLEGQKEEAIKKLKAKLELELRDTSGETLQDGDWDDDKGGKEYDWSEAYCEEKKLFGLRILEIRGDAPYNFGEEIEKVIIKYLNNPEINWSET